MEDLLTRNEFRNAVFERDGYRCVICKNPAQDAHHIIERRLFPDGGYYISNGASVCQKHHLEAESTILSCTKIREAANIKIVVLPPHLYPDQEYDKWGNPILPNGQRTRGELFDDLSVQKVIAPVRHLFTKYVKYPRTSYLPWSPGIKSDDRIIKDLSILKNEEIVVTIKMDGENTSMYNDFIHTRAIAYDSHPSRSRMKAYHAGIAYDIPEGWRICAENLWAKHSIHYKNLPHFCMVFSVWNEQNICLSWDDTLEWCELLDLHSVPVIYRGPWDEEKLHNIYTQTYNNDECEGYVVRVTRSFQLGDFKKCVAKYVRHDHVQSHGHWMRQAIIPNKYQ